MNSCMPEEQQEYLDNLANYMLEATNMSKEEAESFAFRLWQFKDSDKFKKIVFDNPQTECLDKVIAIQKENLTDNYMIGLYNGLVTAKCILNNVDNEEFLIKSREIEYETTD